jgi:TfoX/Sxy family transcriptional regulator of competence genes
MAYDEQLAQRVRDLLDAQPDVAERKMFGGLAFMVGGHMCCGVIGEELIVRLDPPQAEELRASEPGARPMDFTGRPMRGWLYVAPEAIAEDENLETWVGRAENFASSLPAK